MQGFLRLSRQQRGRGDRLLGARRRHAGVRDANGGYIGLGLLLRDDAADGEAGATVADRLRVGKRRFRRSVVRLRLDDVGAGLGHAGLRHRELRFDVLRVEPRENLTGLDDVALVGAEYDENAADLEADVRLHARADGAEPIDAFRDAIRRWRNRHVHRPKQNRPGAEGHTDGSDDDGSRPCNPQARRHAREGVP